MDNNSKELNGFWSHSTNCIMIWILCILVLFIGIWSVSATLPRLTCDNYFMFLKSEEFLKNGFFHEDHLSMHSGLHCVFTQWLFAVPLTLFKHAFGLRYLHIVGIALLFIASLSTILSNHLIGKDSKLGWVFIFLSFSYICVFTGKIRPFYISAFLMTMTYLVLEKYVKDNDWKMLAVLPFISIIFINIHNTLYFGMYLPYACFIGEWILGKILTKIQSHSTRFAPWIRHADFDIKPVLLSIPACLLTSLINPYGLEYVLYFIPSMQAVKPLIATEIGEMQSMFSPQYMQALILIAGYLILEIILVLKHVKKMPMRHLFCFFGYLFMFLRYERNAILFLTCGQVAMFYITSQYRFSEKLEKESKIMISGILVVILAVAIYGSIMMDTGSKKDDIMHIYPNIDKIVEKNNSKGKTIFTSHQYAGSYAAYNGLKPYIDACAETYGIAVNKKADIASEFVNMSLENKIKKYEFDYVVVSVSRDAAAPEFKGYEVVDDNLVETSDGHEWRNLTYKRQTD